MPDDAGMSRFFDKCPIASLEYSVEFLEHDSWEDDRAARFSALDKNER